MVSDFNIARIPIIQFGAGRIGLLPSILKQHKGEILIILSKSLSESTTVIQLEKDLYNLDVKFEIISSHGEPTNRAVDETVNYFRTKEIAAVCAIGGGSIIDLGKAVSAMLKETGQIEDYLEGVGTKSSSGLKIPFIAVPTTAGTGSEATKNSVISKEGPLGYKRSLRHENYVPDICLIDPELSISCPPSTTAASGMDAFTQLLESYLSTNANPFTDALAIKGMTGIKDALLSAYRDGKNLNARSMMSFAALSSGITLANVGLGAVHGFASSVGGHFNIPHGVICGTLLAETNRANVNAMLEEDKALPKLEKIAAVGRLFFSGIKTSREDAVERFCDLLFELTTELQIPKLGAYGMKDSDVEKILENTDQKNNPVKLSVPALKKILINRI